MRTDLVQLVLVACALMFGVSVAHAAPNGVLFVQPASDAAPSLIDQAMAVARRHFTDAQQAVVPVQDAGCDLDCGVQRLGLNNAAMAVQLELWIPRGFRREGSVAVTLKDGRGSSVGRSALEDVSSEAIADAVSESLDQALARWPSRGGVLVQVEGTPSGASVIVDHDPELGGVLPIELRLTPGSHTVTVSQYGYSDENRSVVVPAHLDDPMVVRIDLVSLSAPGAKADPAAKARPNRWPHFAGAGALAVAGIAAVVVGSIGLAQDGDCSRRSPSGFCAEREQSNRGASISYLVAGAAAVVGAGAWGAWAYLSLSPQGGELGVRMPFQLAMTR